MNERLKDSISVYIGATFSIFIGAIGFMIAIFIILAIGGYIGKLIGSLFSIAFTFPIVSRQRLITFKELKNRIKRAKRQKNKDLFDMLNFAEKHYQDSVKVYNIELARDRRLTCNELSFKTEAKIHARRRLHPRDITKDVLPIR